MSSNKQRRKAATEKRDSKKFFTIVGISVAVLMLLLYLMFRSM